jgi:uncharacterized membrane protein
VTRYSFPSFIGVQIAVAYTLTTRTGASWPVRSRLAWQCSMALLFVLGLSAGATIAQADVWWNKDPGNYFQAAGRQINAAKNPVIVISDAWFVPMLSLEHKLRPDIRYQLTVEPNVPDIHQDAGTIFAVNPSAHLRAELKGRFEFELVDRSANLWRLTARNQDREERASEP